MELITLTLAKAAALIRKREISSLELVQAYLERIERLNPRLNCFITLTADAATQRAREGEETLQKGAGRGALHGIPLALKDLFETRGVRTTAGSRSFANYLPEADCTVVEKLSAAGAVILGKLNMHEIALGVTNVNPHFGECHNPWNEERIPGGSSGGSAAAVAAGLCLGSLGSDTGGSIRIPAALCGVVGLKPTYGRISLRGVIPLSWNLDHVGPLARDVLDAAILLQAAAGYDPADPYSVNAPVDDYLSQIEGDVHGWRVALASDPFFTQADDEVLTAVWEAARLFANLGARVEEVTLPNGREMAQANLTMVASDGAAFHRERLESQPQDFGADVLERLRYGLACSSLEYSFARRIQTLARHQFGRFFADFDILLTPTTPVTAPLIAGPNAVEQARLLTRFTAPFNLSGLPALSLPCGFSREGLPIGLQIIGPAWGEARLLRAARAYEQATEWHTRLPVL